MNIAALILIAVVAVALDFLSRFLFPRVLLPLSAGVTADLSAEYGQFALQQNMNAYVLTPQAAIATAGTNTNLTAAQLTNGVIQLTAGASGGFTITLSSTAAIIQSMGTTILTNGTFGIPIFIQNNNVGQTGTVTAGDASTTLSGTMTIATNTTRLFLLAVTGPSTITLTNVGSLTL